jgi:Fic family protein
MSFIFYICEPQITNTIMSTDEIVKIISFLEQHPTSSSKEIHNGAFASVSYATIKRELSKLILNKIVSTTGKGKGTKYSISPTHKLFYAIEMDQYFKLEVDERQINERFNLKLISGLLEKTPLFTNAELNELEALQATYRNNISQLSDFEYQKELERLAIDLSWKSSQIEGNTYSLLETEHLLKEKETASGKTKDEAIMLLNHKEAIDFIVNNKDYLSPLTISRIEDIHKVLVKGLDVDSNIRKRRVGITGTNYKPLDNEFQIKEALSDLCHLINNKNNIFEKALLSLLLISYIQPFADGNKRTARIISNAVLMDNKHCPISYRTVDSINYKKALLLFYEQNNITAFKKLFIDQFEFAVKTYF